MQDEIYMRRAIKLAKLGRFTTHPNPNVGCVIVNSSGIIVGEGYHYFPGDKHAEIKALNIAKDKARDSTVYITLEPCSHYGNTPPCCDALIKAGIKRIFIAIKDPNPLINGQGIYRLKQAGINVNLGLLKNEAENLNKGFLKRMRTGLPYIQVKLAVSLDGRTAMSNGESKWISSKESRCDAQYIRAQSHAILTSYKTVLADDPLLTVRWNELNKKIQKLYPEKDIRQPIRIILDNHNKIEPKQRMIQQSGEIIFIRTFPDNRKWPKNLRDIIISHHKNNINLVFLMSTLGKYEINSILVEAGATLVGALIQSKLVDELIIYLAPKLLGNKAKCLCVLPSIKSLINAPQFGFTKIHRVGSDLRLNIEPKYT